MYGVQYTAKTLRLQSFRIFALRREKNYNELDISSNEGISQIAFQVRTKERDKSKQKALSFFLELCTCWIVESQLLGISRFGSMVLNALHNLGPKLNGPSRSN